MRGDRLSIAQKLSYGVGHVLNDLTASMWFSYLIIYLHRVVVFQNYTSGYMMLLGQIADAISTAFVGFESDRTQKGFLNYGRRKSWHLVGIISVLLSFPFMFNLCVTCENAPEWARFLYYAPFVVIFQFGWASTQISHLALIPELTPCENERVALNALRYAFTVACNLFVYGVTYLLFKLNNSDQSDENLSRADSSKFMYLTFIVCGVGTLFQVVFHCGIKENVELDDSEEQNSQPKFVSHSYANQKALNWLGYLKAPSFYFVGLLYMCSRLIVNMTQVYFPMFLTDTLNLNKSSIALIPFVCYTSGFLATFPLRYLTKLLGSYITNTFGILLIFMCSALFWFQDLIYDNFVTSIVSSVLLGAASSIILVTSLSLVTDLIGKNTDSGAFVYGAMSFTDKLSNGIAVAILEQFSPCDTQDISSTCKSYYHFIMALLPSICGVLCLISLIAIYITRKQNDIDKVYAINQEEVEHLVNENNTLLDQSENTSNVQITEVNYGTINTNVEII